MSVIAKIEPAEFRSVLGAYPTGVCVVTGQNHGHKLGITIGSFTAISLDPPLVGFFIDQASRRWPPIAEAGRFCVNILGIHQLRECQFFTRQQAAEFTRFIESPAGTGMPVIEDAIAWVECEVNEIRRFGDHDLVTGKVMSLSRGRNGTPLVFWSGSFRELAEQEPAGVR
jgi:3-hydroxy-9,10-secoandrosta-1,3,5(10)-triene-9,17-dione monooxygenase reductase component